jgi:hypothetical protein
MNYKQGQKLNKLRPGDTLTLKDGSIHEAVEDRRSGAEQIEACKDCSMLIIYSDSAGCDAETNNSHLKCEGNFHFKLIKP